MDKGGRPSTFLRNRKFIDYDPEFEVDREVAMATKEGTVGGGSCLPLRRPYKKISGYAGAALRRAGSTVSGVLKGTLAKLTHSSSSSAARLPRRKTVSWAPSVGA